VQVAPRTEGRSIRITVEDTGEGMAAGFPALRLRSLPSGEVSMSRTQGGLGLGLALVRQLVEMQGGQVSASERRHSGWDPTVPHCVPAASAVR
jgi:signal transduction histidine kinase